MHQGQVLDPYSPICSHRFLQCGKKKHYLPRGSTKYDITCGYGVKDWRASNLENPQCTSMVLFIENHPIWGQAIASAPMWWTQQRNHIVKCKVSTNWEWIPSKLAFVELFGNFVHSIDPNLLFRAMQGVSLFIQNSACLRHVQSSRLNSMKRFELLESSLRSNWSSFSAPNWLSGYSGCRTSSCSRDCLGIVPANDGAWANTLRYHLIHQKWA